MLQSDDHIANLHFYVLAKMIAALGLMPEHAEDGMSHQKLVVVRC